MRKLPAWVGVFLSAGLAFACGPSAGPTIIATPTAIVTPTAIAASAPPSAEASPVAAVRVPAIPAGSGTWGPYGGTAVTVGGVYFIDLGGLRYTFMVPTSGWWTNDYGDWLAVGKVHGDKGPMTRLFINANDIGDDPGEVSTDACHWMGSESIPGATVDDLVAAWAAVDGFESSEPSETTVGGYRGKHLRLTVPADVNMADCDNGQYFGVGGFWDIQPGQVQDIWVFDADGARRVIWSAFDGNTPAEAQADLTQLINSLQIEKVAS